MEESKFDPLEILVQPGDASFSEILEFYLALEKVYVAMGGSGLRISSEDKRMENVPESPYELHKGTPFENTQRVVRDSIFPRYIPRQQVYDAIDKFVRPKMTKRVRQDLDQRFPRNEFGDNFPYCATMDLLFNGPLKNPEIKK